MTGPVLFVDLENVQTADLSAVPATARVVILYGTHQKKLPEELVLQAQPLGTRLTWLRIAGQGPNALDFHIAFHLGQELAANPKSACLILSKDTGFDPLIRHLAARGHNCRRVTSLTEAFPLDGQQADHFVRLVELLKQDKTRPARMKGLAAKLKSWFPKLPDDERQVLLKRLFDEAHVRESGAVLTWNH